MRLLLDQHGVVIGTLLLLSVTLCAFLLARKATTHISRFREEHHERFVRPEES